MLNHHNSKLLKLSLKKLTLGQLKRKNNLRKKRLMFQTISSTGQAKKFLNLQRDKNRMTKMMTPQLSSK
jgi:hypothetical protein